MDTLIPWVEAAAVALLLVLSWRVLVAPVYHNVLRVLVFLSAGGAAGLGGLLAWAAAGAAGRNALAGLLAAAAAGAITFVVASTLLTAWVRRRDVAGRLARRFPLGRGPTWLLNLAGVAALWGVALVGAVAWATVAGVSPLRGQVEAHSFLLKHLLPKPAVPAPLAAHPGAGSATAGHGVVPAVVPPPPAGLVGLVARATGAAELAAWLISAQDVARLIGELSPPEQLLVLQHSPGLRRLAAHPRVRALVTDRQVMALAELWLAGDAGAITQLAAQPTVTALLGDESFRRQAFALDLAALRAELPGVRLPATRLLPGRWQTTALAAGEEVEDCRKDDSRWRVAPGTCILVWPGSARRGGAVTELQLAEPMHVVLYLDGGAPSQLSINGQEQDLTVGVAGQLASTDLPAGSAVVTLAATLRGGTRLQAITVEIFGEPLAGAGP